MDLELVSNIHGIREFIVSVCVFTTFNSIYTMSRMKMCVCHSFARSLARPSFHFFFFFDTLLFALKFNALSVARSFTYSNSCFGATRTSTFARTNSEK